MLQLFTLLLSLSQIQPADSPWSPLPCLSTRPLVLCAPLLPHTRPSSVTLSCSAVIHVPRHIGSLSDKWRLMARTPALGTVVSVGAATPCFPRGQGQAETGIMNVHTLTPIPVRADSCSPAGPLIAAQWHSCSLRRPVIPRPSALGSEPSACVLLAVTPESSVPLCGPRHPAPCPLPSQDLSHSPR